MASSTTNLGLIKPAGNEKIRIAQINQNSDTIDNAIGAVGSTSLQAQVSAIEDGIAIVANGDSHVAITAGQFVYVRNNTHNLAEGLYVASANVSANASITSSNMTADASGGLNALNANMVYKSGDSFSMRSYHAVGRVINSGKGLFCWIDLAKPCTATSASFEFGNYVLIFGLGSATPTRTVSAVTMSGNEISFVIDLSSSHTPGDIGIVEFDAQITLT